MTISYYDCSCGCQRILQRPLPPDTVERDIGERLTVRGDRPARTTVVGRGLQLERRGERTRSSTDRERTTRGVTDVDA